MPLYDLTHYEEQLGTLTSLVREDWGLLTRVEALTQFLQKHNDIHAFKQSLGNKTIYRAIALTNADYERVKHEHYIHTRGGSTLAKQGHSVEEIRDKLSQIKKQYSPHTALTARVFCWHMLMPTDFTYSVSEIPEQQVLVASQYSEENKSIYLFKLNIQESELLDITLQNIDPSIGYFVYAGHIVDGKETGVERFGVLGIPLPADYNYDTVLVLDPKEADEYTKPYTQRNWERYRDELTVFKHTTTYRNFLDATKQFQKRHPALCTEDAILESEPDFGTQILQHPCFITNYQYIPQLKRKELVLFDEERAKELIALLERT